MVDPEAITSLASKGIRIPVVPIEFVELINREVGFSRVSKPPDLGL